MNGTSAQILREHDPKYLRRRRWERRGVFLVAMLAVVAVGAAGFAVASAIKVERRVTKVEQSACADAQADPTDLKALHECQVIRAAAERTANQNVNCIPFLRAGYVCPKPGSPLAEERRAREIREAVGPRDAGAPARKEPATSRAGGAPSGGDATSSPHTGSSQPGPHGSGGGSEHASGGSHHAPAPGEPGSAPPSSPTSTTSPQPAASTERTSESTVVEAAPEATAGGLTEGVGNTVEGLGETVGGTVEHVEATTCTLAKVLCPE
jgi:hypothetical protein